MDPVIPNDVQQLIGRAEEARAVAALVINPESKLMMLRIARCYERLAELTAKSGAPNEGTPFENRARG